MMETVSPRPHLVVSLLAAALTGVLGVALWSWQGVWPRRFRSLVGQA